MKKIVCLLIALMAIWSVSFEGLSAKAATETDMLEWHKSEDGLISFAIVSLDTSSYPQIGVTMHYKVDDNLTNSATSIFDISPAVVLYTNKYPALRNRKATVTCTIDDVYSSRAGIEYIVKFNMKVGGEVNCICRARLNLWEAFPDDFIDQDIFCIASAIDLYKKEAGLYHPSSLTINGDAYMQYDNKDPNLVYYRICLNAMNRVGGYTNLHIVVAYNMQTAKMDIVDADDYEYIIYQGAKPKTCDDLTMCLIIASSVHDYDIPISQHLIEKAMK